jgi:putative two-component system response regulator
MARILLIDDEAVIRDLIAEILVDGGHDVTTCESAEEALARLDDAAIELVVSDIIMPGLSGLELLSAVRERRPSLPVVLVTGAGTHATLTEALAGGADGLVMKPFTHAELQRTVATTLDRAGRAERELRERLLTPTLAGALANAIEARDSTMQGHCERLSTLAVAIAAELELPADEIETIRLGAILHDIGKIGIPDRVLIKEGPLADEERALMRTHPLIGDRLLEPLDLLASVRPVVRHHHERWNGSGYPDGLAGDEIPLAARIVAIADAVEAMSGIRLYRAPLHTARIAAELAAGAGVEWDPALVEIVLEMIDAGRLRFGAGGLAVVDPDAPPEAIPAHAVLLVAASRDDARLAREALERGFGHVALTHAANAAGALELCRGASWSLVVVDQRLPDARGIDLMETLRAQLPDVPVILMTADEDAAIAVDAFRRGATDCVVKSAGFVDELAERARTAVTAPTTESTERSAA